MQEGILSSGLGSFSQSSGDGLPGTVSSKRLNCIASLVGAQNYLEIGVSRGETLEAVDIAIKVGVDPRPRIGHIASHASTSVISQTSDQFFESDLGQHAYDLVFLDGLHTAAQTAIDLANVLRSAKPELVVLIDDVIPDSTYSAESSLGQYRWKRIVAGLTTFDWRPLGWQGDVFRMLPHLATMSFLSWVTVVEPGEKAQVLLWLNREGQDLVDSREGRRVVSGHLEGFVREVREDTTVVSPTNFFSPDFCANLVRDRNIWMQPQDPGSVKKSLKAVSFGDATARLQVERG